MSSLLNNIKFLDNKQILDLIPKSDLSLVNDNGDNVLILSILYNKSQNIILELIKTGECNLEQVGNDGNTALTLACKNKMEEVALKLIKSGHSHPEHIDNNGNTALIYACNNLMDRVALELIKTEHSNPRKINNKGNTALTIACELKMNKVALELIKTGESRPEHINNKGDSVLLLALKFSSEEVVLELIKTGNSKPEHVSLVSTKTALIIACELKMEKVALELIRTGRSNPGHVNRYKSTALIWACTNKLEQVALEIIATGQSNPGQVNNAGNTALLLACFTKMEKVALELIKTGESNPDYINIYDDGNTALIIACDIKLNKVALELIDIGLSNLDHINAEGNTALIFASKNGMLDVVDKLLKTGKTNPNHRNNIGKNANYYINLYNISVPNIEGRYYNYKSNNDDYKYDFFNYTYDLFTEKINDKNENIIIKMIPKGTLLFSYITPNIDNTKPDKVNYNNVLSQFLANFNLDEAFYFPNEDKFQFCLSNFNNRLKYFYLYPKYGEIFGKGSRSTCITYRTKRDIFVASLKSGTDILSKYSRAVYINNDSTIIQKCENFPNYGCKEATLYDICINNKFYNNQKIDGNTANAKDDSEYLLSSNDFLPLNFNRLLTYLNQEHDDNYNNYVSLLYQMFSSEVRSKNTNNSEEIIGMEEIVLLPRGYQNLPDFTDEDKKRYNLESHENKYIVKISSDDMNNFFNKYIKDYSPLEIVSISSYFGNLIFNHKENKIIEDLTKPSDLFGKFYSNTNSSIAGVNIYFPSFGLNIVNLFNTIGVSYNLHFGVIHTKFNLTSSEIEKLNSDIIMDVQIRKSYEHKTDEILDLLRICGTDYYFDLTNKENSDELFKLHTLKMICNYIFPEYRNTIFLVKYKENEYLIDTGSIYINYDKYEKDGGKERLKLQLEFYNNEVNKNLNGRSLNYVSVFNNVYNYFKDKNYENYFIPIAKYYPQGYNKNRTINYVDDLDVILYDERFIMNFKPDFEEKSIFKNKILSGGFSNVQINNVSNEIISSPLVKRDNIKNIKNIKNISYGNINKHSHKKNKYRQIDTVKSKKINKTKQEIKKNINEIIEYGNLWRNIIKRYNNVFI